MHFALEQIASLESGCYEFEGKTVIQERELFYT